MTIRAMARGLPLVGVAWAAAAPGCGGNAGDSVDSVEQKKCRDAAVPYEQLVSCLVTDMGMSLDLPGTPDCRCTSQRLENYKCLSECAKGTTCGAVGADPTPGADLETCAKNCPSPGACADKCKVGENGAQCSADTDCGFNGGVCNTTTCQCVGGTGGAGGAGGAGGTGGAGGSGGAAIGKCTYTCSFDSDCTTYQDKCVDGECKATCLVDGCESGTGTCVVVLGLQACQPPCVDDTDCVTGTACVGVDDNGTKFCTNHGCTVAADCGDGYYGTKCLSGICACETDTDCGSTSQICSN